MLRKKNITEDESERIIQCDTTDMVHFYKKVKYTEYFTVSLLLNLSLISFSCKIKAIKFEKGQELK